jgi:uncharacterized protein
VDDVVPLLVRFGHELRREGIAVGPARIRTFCEAAAVLPWSDLYWAGRASLLWRAEQIPVYDETFRRYFGPGEIESDDESAESSQSQTVMGSIVAGEGAPSGAAARTASHMELLQTKSFARCTDEEWRELAALASALPPLLPVRRTRRYHRGRPGSLDVRRVLRRAAATGGEPFNLPERRRRLRVRPLIFLLDVSGSMSAYSRGLLLFAHATLRTSPATEVYAFGTRLTRITDSLTAPSFDVALQATESIVPDWDGGTRIGDALAALLSLRGHRADTRRAVALICSDGLETGDPAPLGELAARFHRAVHRVVWLNPLKEDPDYAPLARGMRAVLPHVDVFESGHSMAALLSVLSRLDPHAADRSRRPA